MLRKSWSLRREAGTTSKHQQTPAIPAIPTTPATSATVLLLVGENRRRDRSRTEQSRAEQSNWLATLKTFCRNV
ncbi:hypothetical protein HZH68_016601 [Vespula germanica]|uniref:Uncharacterized protein n=1 Tax=Vespula germanica TaxID=30212 RepID=A0A834MQX3_VESGE|nr:hypothetical protein HZH68_016601 [Vespula germanica]